MNKKNTLGLVVATILGTILGVIVGAMTVGKLMWKEIQALKEMSSKHFTLFLMMNQWVKNKQNNKEIATYLDRNGYKRIAVYGMSYAGKTLIEELKNSDIHVAYGIDKNADSLYADIDIMSMEDELPDVDAVVVTAITFYDEIEKELQKKIKCSIVSLEDILYEV